MRRFPVASSLLLLVAAGLIGLTLLVFFKAHELPALAVQVQEGHWFFTTWRIISIAMASWFLPRVFVSMTTERSISSPPANAINRWRIRTAGWLLSIELLLGQRMIAMAIEALFG